MSPLRQSKIVAPALLRSWPLPEHSGSKNDRGCVLVVAGSQAMPGPVILAATAALRAGAGLLQIATTKETTIPVGCAVPEALVVPFDEAETLAERADAIVCGPGMDANGESRRLLRSISRRARAPLVLDAAALQAIDGGDLPSNAVLTPHAGEMAKMLRCERAEIERDPAAALERALQQFPATIVLKGERTFIADPESDVYCNTGGTVGLATSGSGDVLAGIIGGLLARGASPLQAAVWGVYAHARAGSRLASRSAIGFLAREIASEVPAIFRTLR